MFGKFIYLRRLTRLEPVGRGEAGGLTSRDNGQAGEHVREVFLGIDAQAAAVFDDGVEDGALLTGHLISDEQPVFCTKFGRADRVFDEIMPPPDLCRTHKLEAHIPAGCHLIANPGAA